VILCFLRCVSKIANPFLSRCLKFNSGYGLVRVRDIASDVPLICFTALSAKVKSQKETYSPVCIAVGIDEHK
jgi:hypothetical protein